MFPVSDFLREIIQSDDRSFLWNGTITFEDGTVTNFDMENIVQSSGSLRGSCNYPGLGEAVATELSIQMYLDIDVERLKNAVIQLNCQVLSDVNIDTWGGASSYSWLDLSGVKWGASPKTITANIPMGVYNVVKAKRKTLGITITAYDNMQKLDVEFKELDTVARTPYNWLSYCCDKCGIAFGMTNEEVKRFPNGSRLMTYANVNNDIKTYRNLVQRIASALCAVAIMDRYGRLKLVPCVSEPVLEYTPDDRFSSEFEDYKSKTTGIYLQHKPSGIQKYYTNAEVPEDDAGSIIDLGANPFLQGSNEEVRDASVQAIVDEFKDFEITPFDMNVPFDPTLELMDVVEFTGSHAPSDAMAPITDFTLRINGDMNLRCEASETSADLLRADKISDGASGSGADSSYGNTGFWLNVSSYPKEATEITTETDTTSLSVELSIENSRVQIAWTGCYELSADAIVTAKVYVNNDLIYTVNDAQTSGKHILNVTTGHDIKGIGNYKFKVSLSVSSGKLSISADDARLTVLGYGWYGTVTSGESWSESGQIFKDIADLLEYEYPYDTNWDDVACDYDVGDIDYDSDGIYVPAETFNYVADQYHSGSWGGGTGPKKYKFKVKNNKPYVNVNQEGGEGDDSIPYEIKITTPATKLIYDPNEEIDLTGMVVKAYDVAGDLWTSTEYPDSVVPLDEIEYAPKEAPE